MMNRIKCIVLLLGIILPTAFSFANSGLTTEKDGVETIVINQNSNNGEDRSGSISASIDSHILTVSFTENLGQVTIRILNENNISIDCITTPTPTGYQIYIPSAGRYIVTFTLPNGDEYYGEFEVTE